jgi:hypothetical protein
MRNRIAFALGAAVSALVAAIVITQERLENFRLRQTVVSLQADPRASQQPFEDKIVSAGVPQAPVPAIPAANEPSAELLRLRGEVGRLRLENENLLQEKDQQLKDLLLARGRPSLMERYWAKGFDTNTIPNVHPGNGTNEVLSELQRVGARLIEAETSFIHAEVTAHIMSNNAPIQIDMVFYLDERGRVTSLGLSHPPVKNGDL